MTDCIECGHAAALHHPNAHPDGAEGCRAPSRVGDACAVNCHRDQLHLTAETCPECGWFQAPHDCGHPCNVCECALPQPLNDSKGAP